MKNKKTIVTIGVLVVLLVVGWLAIPASREDDGTAEERRASQQRTSEPSMPREEAFRLLKDYRKRGAERITTFDDVERLAARLGTAELLELVGEHVIIITGTLDGWVRCAAYAELGRRDPASTLAQVRRARLTQQFRVEDAAQYSIYRGWAEVDPVAALKDLTRPEVIELEEGIVYRGLDQWKKSAYRELFTEFIKSDRDQALNLLQSLPEQGYRSDGWEGIFAGIGDPAGIKEIWQRWEASNGSHGVVSIDLPNPGLFTNTTVERDRAAFTAAQVIAESDLPAALAFLGEKNPTKPIGGVLLEMLLLREYGRRHPAEAVELIRSDQAEIGPRHLAIGVAWRSPDRIGEMLEFAQAELGAAAFLGEVISGQGTTTVDEQLPRPGVVNQLTDYEERYEHLLTAIEEAVLTEREAELLRGRLNQEFAFLMEMRKNEQ